VLRGMQKGKRPHKFDYEQLSEGGRGGLIIKDFLHENYAGFQWDLRPFLERGLPCLPMGDLDPKVYSEWDVARMAQDARDIGYTDENLLYELESVGFRSFSTAAEDNTVALSANYAGFFEAVHFIDGKCEEERAGSTKKRLFGAYDYPPFLVARLHPRNVATQRGPDGKVIKQRQTVDCAFPRPKVGKKWPVGMSISWNDNSPLDDKTLFPDVEWGTIDAFARGTSILSASGLPVGLFKCDLRAFFRFMIQNSRELHANAHIVNNLKKWEVDHALQCAPSPRPTLTSPFRRPVARPSAETPEGGLVPLWNHGRVALEPRPGSKGGVFTHH
jgi:hypothetical protein